MDLQNEKCPIHGDSLIPTVADLTGSTVMSFQCPKCLSARAETNSKIQDLKIFNRCLLVAYKQFCICRELHKEIKSDFYNKFKQQWDAILVALEIDYKLWLGKILERNYTHECLKNYQFSDEHDKETDKQIMNWRDEFLAHFSLKTLRDYEGFIERHSLDDNSVQNLFYKIAEVVNQYGKKFSMQNLTEAFIEIEKGVSADCDKWLDSFKKQSFWKKLFSKVWQ